MYEEEPRRVAEPEASEMESDAESALEREARERRRMSAREFVSERDALEDAWSGSGDRDTREEGW